MSEDMPMEGRASRWLSWLPFCRTGGRLRGCLSLLGALIAWSVFLGSLALLAGAVWLQRAVLSDLPDVQQIVDYKPPQACRVLDSAGEEIDVFYVERRFWVPLGVLPEHLLDAFVAAEDQRFWEHPGVDVRGILRAARANYRSGGVVQGGSTITQQLVKNLLVGDERRFVRKAKEAALAIRLEKRLSKRAILELYLNYVFLGAGNHGVEAAARDYFGVSARDVDHGQAALLAGLVPAPSRSSPRLHPRAARAARSRVLDQMQALGTITEAHAFRISALPVVVPAQESVAVGGLSYITSVRRELRERYGEQAATAGLTVHTAMDARVQRLAEDGVRLAVRELLERQGKGGVRGFVPDDERDRWLARADGLTDVATPPTPGTCFPARIPKRGDLAGLAAGPFTFALSDDERRTVVRFQGRRERVDRLPAGTVLSVCALEEEQVTLDPTPWAEGSAVVLDNATGHVLAVVGGRNVALEGFDRATQALRQPGSAFKPFVYAAALMAGKSNGDLVDTSYLTIRVGRRTWSPRDSVAAGAIPLRDALAFSSNRASVRLLQEVGAERVADVARAMGIRSELRADTALALGASEVTPLDMAVAYSTIARLGRPVQPTLLTRVRRADGDEDDLSLPPPEPAIPPGVAYELLDMMRGVIERGTGKRARRDGLDRAGKTGTTNDAVDAWFVGFTPEHTVAVWVGSDEPEGLGRGEAGGRTALPGWAYIVDALQEGDTRTFPRPPDVLVAPNGSGTRIYRRGTTPSSVLRLHRQGDEPLPTFPGAAVAL